MFVFFIIIRLRPPISTLTDTLSPYTTLVRSATTGYGRSATTVRLWIVTGSAMPTLPLVAGSITPSVTAPAHGDATRCRRRRPIRSRPERGPFAVCSGPEPVLDTQITQACESARSEEHTSELQSLMRISYAVFCLKKKTQKNHQHNT